MDLFKKLAIVTYQYEAGAINSNFKAQTVVTFCDGIAFNSTKNRVNPDVWTTAKPGGADNQKSAHRSEKSRFLFRKTAFY